MLPIFTVLRLSDDPEIIESIRPSATPTNQDTKAKSLAILSVTPLDLDSQTDKNTTPVNTIRSIATSSGDNETKHKRPAKDDIGSESSNVKKNIVEVKIEKDA
ncbi:hypothetical protein Tco_0282373 [Tanacetum coccineum]